ncbi:MAG: hypothetical protein ACE5NG_17780 [bacterium]
MAGNKNQSKRKLSVKEAQENDIKFQERKLDLFPKLGKPFKLKVSKKEFNTFVHAVECWCRRRNNAHTRYRSIHLMKYGCLILEPSSLFAKR